jgi:hypothetical protein
MWILKFFTAILKNSQVFCDVVLTCYDNSEMFLALKTEALCTVCRYCRLWRPNISQKTILHRILHQICAMEINTDKNDLTLRNVVLKSYVYICFNIWDGVLTTQRVCVFMLLWKGMETLYPKKVNQILIIMPVQCLSCETGYKCLNIF